MRLNGVWNAMNRIRIQFSSINKMCSFYRMAANSKNAGKNDPMEFKFPNSIESFP